MDAPKDKAARLGSNPSLPYLLGCCCLGLILFGIALTIVMSLIPTYLPSKADGMSRVNATSMESYLHAKAASTTTGRKRASSSLDDYIGCKFGSSGREQVRQVLRQCLTNSLAKDLTVNSVEVVYSNNILAYLIAFVISFDGQCLYECQSKLGTDIQQCLYNVPPGSMVFKSVPMYAADGVTLLAVLSQLRTLGISYVSAILPGLSPFRPGTGPTIRRSTSSMTTANMG